MTERPGMPMHGVVDLSALARGPAAPAGAAPAGAPDQAAATSVVVTLTEANFDAVANESTRVPVIVCLWAQASPAAVELKATFEALAAEYSGKFLLATVDVQAEPTISQAFQVQAVPAVLAILAGRPAPLFQGGASEEQTRGILDQVLEIAAEQGVTGTIATGDAEDGAEPAEPQPEPLPPLHQEAFDAIERGDFDGATAAYEQALRENPKDADARAGLAQVGLLARTSGKDLQAVRKAAADAPGDAEAQMAVADMDVLGGMVEDAFARLIDLIAVLPGDAREPVRLRLVELFEVVGGDDARVNAARRALSAALF